MTENKFKLFTEGDELYRDMLDGIACAKKSISLESYIFEPDSTGMLFIDTLIERASTDIEIRIHLDAFGSLNLLLSKQFERIKNSAIKLKWYNKWNWFRPLRFNHRNHRKLLVIDESITWLGGFNIHNENSLREYGEDRWLDTHVRIEGPLAADACALFNQLWEKPRDDVPDIDTSLQSLIVSNVTWRQRRQFRQILTQKFKSAKTQIWLCTPYFMPDRFLLNQLVRAAIRGVDVRLLLPYKTDRPVARWVARAAYHSLIKSGVRIYEYSPRFLHAKIMLIDNQWVSVGSTNLDYRSFFINLELNLMSSDIQLVESLHSVYLKNLDASKKINPEGLIQNKWLSTLYVFIGKCCSRIL